MCITGAKAIRKCDEALVMRVERRDRIVIVSISIQPEMEGYIERDKIV